MACVSGGCVCPAPTGSADVRLTNTPALSLYPTGAWNGTHIGLVYLEGTGSGNLSDYDVYFALLNPDGTRAVSPDVALTNLTTNDTVKYAPDIAWNGSEFAVIWAQRSGISGTDHYLLRLQPDGTPKGPAVNISANTIGTKLGDGAPRILWSPQYGGYLVALVEGVDTFFQRIGVNGATPEPVNMTSLSLGGAHPGFALSPVGEAAIATKYGLYLYNPDGSLTKPVMPFKVSTSISVSVGSSDVIYDGTTWLSAWHESNAGIYVNRGETKNSPFLAASFLPPTINELPRVVLVPSGTGAIEMVWAQDSQINLRRYLPPVGSNSTLVPLTSPISVLPIQTANGQLTAVHAGSGSLLIVWTDTRWGPTELHTRTFDFAACP
jgi:hypothetical protein